MLRDIWSFDSENVICISMIRLLPLGPLSVARNCIHCGIGRVRRLSRKHDRIWRSAFAADFGKPSRGEVSMSSPHRKAGVSHGQNSTELEINLLELLALFGTLLAKVKFSMASKSLRSCITQLGYQSKLLPSVSLPSALSISVSRAVQQRSNMATLATFRIPDIKNEPNVCVL